VASDVYGLGAILYEILTDRPPFAGGETPEVLQQVIHATPARPRTIVAATPTALEAICLRALAKRPDNRYPSARDLAADVEHWLADEPVTVHRDALPRNLEISVMTRSVAPRLSSTKRFAVAPISRALSG